MSQAKLSQTKPRFVMLPFLIVVIAVFCLLLLVPACTLSPLSDRIKKIDEVLSRLEEEQEEITQKSENIRKQRKELDSLISQTNTEINKNGEEIEEIDDGVDYLNSRVDSLSQDRISEYNQLVGELNSLLGDINDLLVQQEQGLDKNTSLRDEINRNRVALLTNTRQFEREFTRARKIRNTPLIYFSKAQVSEVESLLERLQDNPALKQTRQLEQDISANRSSFSQQKEVANTISQKLEAAEKKYKRLKELSG